MTFSKSSISLEREFQVLYDYEKNNFVDYSEKLNIKLLNLSYKYEVEKWNQVKYINILSVFGHFN